MTDIIAQARVVLEQRTRQYGPAGPCLTRIAELWTSYLGRPVSAYDVCMMMGLLKIGRESQSHQQDNLLDLIGYTVLANEIITRKETSQ